MKSKFHCLFIALALLALSTLDFQPSTAFAQGTAFSYQGQLKDGGSPAWGIYDLRFTIYDSTNSPGIIVAGPVTNTATAVSNGLFCATLDFGAGVFTGAPLWLQVDARTNGATMFTTLLSRQPILPVPYSVMANSASNLLGTLPTTQLSGAIRATNLTGTISLALLPSVVLTNNETSINLTGTFSGNGAGLTGVPGSVSWQNVTGTNQQAQPNTGYIANNAAQVTITLPIAPNLGDIVRVSGVGAGGWVIAQNAGQCIQAGQFGAWYTNWNTLTNWTYSLGSFSSEWGGIASSADGTKLVVVPDMSGGAMYSSTNSGLTWTPTGPASTNFYAIASSADGTKLVAAGGPSGGIWTSTNSGFTWTKTSAPNGSCIASSTDGNKLAVVAFGIYTSTNSGLTWTQTSAPATNLLSIASSADGTKLAASGSGDWNYTTHRSGPGIGIYTSTNSGLTWNRTSAPLTNWTGIASSADGTKLAAVWDSYNGSSWSGGIYLSTNSGGTWTQASVPSSNWNCIASSADGTKLAAGADPGTTYISTDSGVTWIQTSAYFSEWDSIAFSADGTKLAATEYYAIWTAQAAIQSTTTPGTGGYLTASQGSAIELLYTGNGRFATLSHEGTITAY
jgi:hypothetical protein